MFHLFAWIRNVSLRKSYFILFLEKSWFWFSSGFHIQLKSDPVNCGLSMGFSVGSSQSLSMDKLFFIEFPTFSRIDVQALLIYKVLFLVHIFLYSAGIHENTDQKNSVFGHFSRSAKFLFYCN